MLIPASRAKQGRWTADLLVLTIPLSGSGGRSGSACAVGRVSASLVEAGGFGWLVGVMFMCGSISWSTKR